MHEHRWFQVDSSLGWVNLRELFEDGGPLPRLRWQTRSE
jgi:hypothetical protein